MDNNKKTDPNAPKTNWQTISMLVVAALITFTLVLSLIHISEPTRPY